MGVLIWHNSSNGGQGSDLRHHRESSWVLKAQIGPMIPGSDRSVYTGQVWFGSGPSRTDFGEDKSEQVRERSERHSASSYIN